MQLKRLYIKEYKLFKDFTYELPCDYQRYINVLIGINGSGKSTILEAIAEIFSCVVLGEKAKFGFELEYRFKQSTIELPPDYSGFIAHPLGVYIGAEKDDKPKMLLSFDGFKSWGEVPKMSSYQDFIPDGLVVYYSGYSEIMQKICDPHNKKLSENLRKSEGSSVQFYYHEPKLFNVILLSLLAFEYGDVPEFLRQKAKITGLQSLQIKLKKPYWDKTGSLNDFWGATGEVKSFLEFIQERMDNLQYQNVLLTDKFPVEGSFIIEGIGNEYLIITIIGQNKLFEIRDFLIEEKNLFKVLHTMYLDDMLDDIRFSLIKEENSEQKTFSILSEGEQQSITIKGLTELLAGENTLFLFDEPDTFLHPKWQRNFISEIEETIETHRPNELTYLIATHSPQLLSNAKPEKTFVKIIEDGQLVEQTPKHYGREISSILYNLMGVEERNEAIRKELSKLFMLIEDEEVEDAEKLLKDLTEVLGDTDADIQNAMIQLNYLKQDEAD
jgi:predicted ATPase